MNFKIGLLILLLTISFKNLLGQEIVTKKTVKAKTLKLYKEGVNFISKNEYDKAQKKLNKALSIESNFIDAMINLAAIDYYKENWAEAEALFNKVNNLDPEYSAKVFYSLAKCQKEQKKFKMSLKSLETYMSHPKAKDILIQKAIKERNNLKFLLKNENIIRPFEPEPYNRNINSNSSEFLPCLSPDGNTLIFTRRDSRGEDLFCSERNDQGDWGPSYLLDGICDSIINEGGPSISANGKYMVFTICNKKGGYGSCDLYYSEKVNGSWSKPENMGTPINSKYWESQPSLSADGNFIFFVSNRKGTLGNKDIWISGRKENGDWTKPKNLGSMINTEGEEQSPYFHPDGQTLYFMSDYHPGYGGTDIFFSRFENKKWSKPFNLGYPINTKHHEGALVVSLDGKTGIFASDKKYTTNEKSNFDNEGQGNELDLYHFELPLELRPKPVTYVKAIVVDKKTKKPLRALVEFYNNDENKLTSTQTDNEGEFLFCLPINNTYSINVKKEGYIFYSDLFNLNDLDETSLDPYLITVELEKVKVQPDSRKEQKKVTLKNIFFHTNSFKLKDESNFELNNLVQLLKDNPFLKIQIVGHTDNIGNKVDNQILSENRAKAVINYLVENSIERDRLSFLGKGESDPIDTNDSPEGQQNNRRTEFIILD